MNRHCQAAPACPKGADSVAKVFLSHRPQIFRAVGAAIEYLTGADGLFKQLKKALIERAKKSTLAQNVHDWRGREGPELTQLPPSRTLGAAQYATLGGPSF